MAVAKLTAPNGATVTVDPDRVENLLRRGFTKVGGSPESAKAPAKKSAPKKSSK